MSRPLRLQYPGAVYHLTSRGNARERIVRDTVDREAFLTLLARVVRSFGWRCHAYCLMDNHYHLLAETPEPNLSLGMRQLNGLYSQAFNRRHGRVGHVFQGRFNGILVQKQAHLLELCRYVVLNPVRAGLRRRVDQWRWSSYRATAGLDAVPDFLTVDWVLGQFAPVRRAAQERYRAFVAAGLGSRPWQDLRGQIYLGDDAFVQSLRPARETREIPRAQRRAAVPPLAEILDGGDDRGIAAARGTYGYQLKEIGEFLGVHPVTVKRRLRRATGGVRFSDLTPSGQPWME